MAKASIDYGKVLMLNSIGMSLREIAEEVGCHYTSVKAILKSYGVESFDTRHSFTYELFQSLPISHRENLLLKLNPNFNLKDYLHGLVRKDLVNDALSDTRPKKNPNREPKKETSQTSETVDPGS